MNGALRILGIDPGLRVTGFGIIDKIGSRLVYVTSGCVKSGEGELPERIKVLLDGLAEVIAAGARRVAIVSGLLNAPDIAEYARTCKKLLIADL